MDAKERLDTEDDVREALGKMLGHPVDPNVFNYLHRHTYLIDEVQLGAHDDALEQLHEAYCGFVQLTRREQPRRKRIVREVTPDGHWEWIASVFAQEADEDPLVQRFRARWLPDGLLEPHEVGDWIRVRAKEDGSPTTWLTVPVPPGTQVLLERGRGSLRPPLVIDEITDRTPWEARWVWWAEKRGVEEACGVTLGGVLGHLWEMVGYLTAVFDWSESAATMFVLTGKAPALPPIRYHFSPRGIRTRLQLDVDVDVPPEKLAAVYRRLRQKARPGRSRPPSAKIQALVSFVLDHPKGSWSDRMTVWNGEHPEWEYSYPSNFSRDFHRARRRLYRPHGFGVSLPYLEEPLPAERGPF